MFLNVYSTLLSVQPDFSLGGYLASSYTATPTKITFTLRKGITCSDGTNLAASDVAASIQAYFDSTASGKLSNFGPGPYGVSADNNANTVTVTLGTPYADGIWGFSDIFPGRQTSIICPAGLAALKANPKALDTPDKTYGTGPYVVSSSVPGGDVELKLRPEFSWGPNGVTAQTPGIPGTIHYQIVTNPTTAANLVQSGAVNLATVTGPDADRLSGDSSVSHKGIPATQVNPMYVNQASGHIGSDSKVRQALITAIDPSLYVKAMGSPGALSTSIVTSNVACFDTQTAKLAPTPSVAAAQQLLVSAGWTLSNGKLSKNGQPLTIDLPARTGFGSAPDYMANAFQQMGASVNLRLEDNGTWISDLQAGKYDVTVLNAALYPPSVGTAAANYAGEFPPTGRNYSRIGIHQQLQDYINQAESTFPSPCAPLNQLQEAMWQDWDILPMYAPITDFFGKGVEISQLININLSVFGVRMLA